MSMKKKIIKERSGLSHDSKIAQVFIDKLECDGGRKKNESNILVLSLHLFSSNDKLSSLLSPHLLLEFTETSSNSLLM